MKIRLCYSSTRVASDADLLQDLKDILTTSRAFNQQRHIHGVLYYSEGIFFQCLEGEREQLHALFDRIKQDPRHSDIHHFQI